MENSLYTMAWVPIGPGDDCIWIEYPEEKDPEEDPDTIIETEEEIENESNKENK